MSSHIKTTELLSKEELSALTHLLKTPQFQTYARALFDRTSIFASIQPSDNPRLDAFAEGFRAAGLLIFNQCQIASSEATLSIMRSPK